MAGQFCGGLCFALLDEEAEAYVKKHFGKEMQLCCYEDYENILKPPEMYCAYIVDTVEQEILGTEFKRMNTETGLMELDSFTRAFIVWLKNQPSSIYEAAYSSSEEAVKELRETFAMAKLPVPDDIADHIGEILWHTAW